MNVDIFILRVFPSFDTYIGNLLVVLEIAENGSLIEFLKKIRSKTENYEGEGAAVSGGLSTDMKLSIALDVAKGMAHLASHRVCCYIYPRMSHNITRSRIGPLVIVLVLPEGGLRKL